MTSEPIPDRSPGSPSGAPVGAEDPAYVARVLRAFVRDGRLRSIPARERKKRVVLAFLVERVLPDDGPISERELNGRLAPWHPDVAALRRYLVDARLVDRTAGVYRRARS